MPDIDLEYVPVGFILETRSPLKVPPYQRAYSWTSDQIDDLMLDLVPFVSDWMKTDDVPDHFFGSIVTVGRKNPGKTTLLSFDVIDGQQRLATFSLLLAALARGFASLKKAAEAADEDDVATACKDHFEHLRDTYLVKVEPKGKTKVTSARLQLSKRDDDFFASITKITDEIDDVAEPPEKPSKPASHARMSDAYQRLNNRFVKSTINDLALTPDQKLERLIAVRDALTQSGSLVNIITGTDAEAYQLFSVLNDRGLALAEGDLLRARTLAMLERYPALESKAEAAWDALLEGEATYVDSFLRDYYASVTGERSPSKDLSRRFLVPREDGLQLLAHESPIAAQGEAEGLVKRLQHMHEEMRVHSSIRQGLWPYEDDETTDWEKSRLVRLVSVLGRTSVIPLLLAVKIARDEPFFRQTVLFLERMDFRYLVVGSHAGSLAEFYWKLARGIRESKRYTFDHLQAQIEPFVWARANDERFKAAIPSRTAYGVSRPQTNRLLHLLTTLNDCVQWLQEEGDKPFYVDASAVWDLSVIDIEHIYPRNAKNQCPDPELEPVKDDFGNLTPWGYKPNRKAGASRQCFDKKRDRYAESDMALTRIVGKEADWNKHAFDNRHDQLLAWALKFYAISEEGQATAEKAEDPDKRAPTSWLVRQNEESVYADVEGEAYDFKTDTRHGRLAAGSYTLAAGDFVMCFRGEGEDSPGIFGIGRVDDVVEEGKSLVATYDWYHAIDPHLAPGGVGSLPPNWNRRNSIHEVDSAYTEAVLNAAQIQRPPISEPTAGT